jgi:hypothetical protein
MRDIRQVLATAIGTVDHVVATLSRAEHGSSRGDVATARAALKSVAADLLTLRARLGAAESVNGSIRDEH